MSDCATGHRGSHRASAATGSIQCIKNHSYQRLHRSSTPSTFRGLGHRSGWPTLSSNVSVLTPFSLHRKTDSHRAIKTNGGRGVAGEGIIKATSSVIYTNARYEILPEESPTRGPDGHIDSMQPQPIKVEAYDKTNALDPMARLDYCDVCEFSFDFPDIKLFGTIHQESRAALDAQYRNAWSKAQVRNPPAAVRSGQTSQPPLATSHNPGNPNSGPITDERLRKIFDDLKAYAKEKELTPPPTGLSQKQWDTLRDDSDTRAKFLGRINNKWLEELQSRRDSQEAGTAIEEEGAVHNTDDEDEESDEEE